MRLSAGFGCAAVAAALACAPAAATARVDVYPVAGTTTANPATQISFRGTKHVRRLRVVGSRSGRHRGRFAVHSDGRGVSFLPHRRFRFGELVSVRSATPLTGAHGGAVRFRVLRPPVAADRAALPSKPADDPGGLPPEAESFRSRPDLHPPGLEIRDSSPGLSPDPIFAAPKAGVGQDGLMIRDAAGGLLWFRRLKPPLSPYDFRTQTYRGRPVLTWWQGRVIEGKGFGYGVMLDDAYRPLMRIRAGNGYRMDLHELQLTPRGTALVTAYAPARYDLRPIGGPRDGYAWDSIVQEIDLRTGLVELEWHSLAHVDPRLSTVPLINGRSADPFHANSIEPDGPGRLLVSSRSTSALFEIDRHTGRVLWRIGGRSPSFAMGPGTPTIGQHDARRQADGTITAFDNGSTHWPDGREERGVRLRVADGHVSLVHAYTHPGFGTLLADSQGSMQVLRNGNVFLSWGGGQSYLSEVKPDGKAVFEGVFQPQDDETYRAYKLPWSGRPARAPDVVASASGSSGTDVWASWNGATSVARWEVLAGASPSALAPVSTAPRSGFETHLAVGGAPVAYVAARALGADGRVLGTSAAVRVTR